MAQLSWSALSTLLLIATSSAALLKLDDDAGGVACDLQSAGGTIKSNCDIEVKGRTLSTETGCGCASEIAALDAKLDAVLKALGYVPSPPPTPPPSMPPSSPPPPPPSPPSMPPPSTPPSTPPPPSMPPTPPPMVTRKARLLGRAVGNIGEYHVDNPAWRDATWNEVVETGKGQTASWAEDESQWGWVALDEWPASGRLAMVCYGTSTGTWKSEVSDYTLAQGADYKLDWNQGRFGNQDTWSPKNYALTTSDSDNDVWTTDNYGQYGTYGLNCASSRRTVWFQESFGWGWHSVCGSGAFYRYDGTPNCFGHPDAGEADRVELWLVGPGLGPTVREDSKYPYFPGFGPSPPFPPPTPPTPPPPPPPPPLAPILLGRAVGDIGEYHVDNPAWRDATWNEVVETGKGQTASWAEDESQWGWVALDEWPASGRLYMKCYGTSTGTWESEVSDYTLAQGADYKLDWNQGPFVNQDTWSTRNYALTTSDSDNDVWTTDNYGQYGTYGLNCASSRRTVWFQESFGWGWHSVCGSGAFYRYDGTPNCFGRSSERKAGRVELWLYQQP